MKRKHHLTKCPHQIIYSKHGVNLIDWWMIWSIHLTEDNAIDRLSSKCCNKVGLASHGRKAGHSIPAASLTALTPDSSLFEFLPWFPSLVNCNWKLKADVNLLFYLQVAFVLSVLLQECIAHSVHQSIIYWKGKR